MDPDSFPDLTAETIGQLRAAHNGPRARALIEDLDAPGAPAAVTPVGPRGAARDRGRAQ